MKFIIDENSGPVVAKWLKDSGYEIFSVYEKMRGATDDAILKKALEEDWVIVTNDKDFGEMVNRQAIHHHGVILMRLSDEHPANQIKVLHKLLTQHEDEIRNKFVVVSEVTVRISKR